MSLHYHLTPSPHFEADEEGMAALLGRATPPSPFAAAGVIGGLLDTPIYALPCPWHCGRGPE